ncbi:MAG TPA: hypothetical protein VHD85_07270 [Terracidiphilus sp.]|nr:hypothetical protein [Terracidiphilus sp.]
MNAHPEAPDELDQIILRMNVLERRLSALEQVLHIGEAPAAQEAAEEPVAAAAYPATVAATGGQFTGALSVFGAALLGIAGAYVLRAVSGASLLPRGLVAAAAAVYAAGWLYAAMRAKTRRLAATLYAATSILILAPMLWEMSIRFAAMPAAVAAGTLALYAALATVAGFSAGRMATFGVAYTGIALSAVALAIGTHQMAPFGAILLCMIGVCELTRVREHAAAVRGLVALSGDFVVWTLLFIYRLPADARSEYPALGAWVVIAAAFLLLLLQTSSIVLRTLRRVQQITVFQILQAMIAFGLLICAFAWLMPAAGVVAIGVLCLVLAGVCYAAAYGPFRQQEQRRNFRIFAVWACALFPGAVFTLAPVPAASALLAAGGLAAVVLGDRTRLPSVELQGVLYLSIAAVASGMVMYAFHALAGGMPGMPQWQSLVMTVFALAAYAVADELPDESADKQALHLVPATLATVGLAAFAVSALARLLSLLFSPGIFHIALLRTITLCSVSFLLAWGGARLRRLQMVRVAYGALAFAAAKLVFEDLRHGRMEFIAASIFLVALTFLGVPRLTRRRGPGTASIQSS